MPKKTSGPPKPEALIILQHRPLKRLVVYRGYGFLTGYNDVANTLHQVLGLPLKVNQNTKQVSFPETKRNEYEPLLNANGYELGIEDAAMDSAYYECETVILATIEERGVALAEEFYDNFEVDLVSVVLLNAITKNLVFETPEGYKLTGSGLAAAKEALALVPNETAQIKNLTTLEEESLQKCEAIVFAHLNSGLAAGEALWEIRNKKLYLKTHPNITAYFWDRFKLSKVRAYQLMRASEAARDALGHGAVQLQPVPLSWQTNEGASENLQPNEAQAAELSRVSREMRAAVFSITAASAPRDEQGRPQLTAPHIRAAAKILTEIAKSRAVEVDGVQYPLGEMLTHQIMQEAHEASMRWVEERKENAKRAAAKHPSRGPAGSGPLLRIFCTYHQQQPTKALDPGEPIKLTLECNCEFILSLETGMWKFIRNTNLKGLVMSDETPIDQF